MKVLVTGANGFIGKNLISSLKERILDVEILEYERNNTLEDLREFVVEADFIFHLAGVNRPQNEEEFFEGNGCLTENIVSILEKSEKKIPILYTSSIQAEVDNPYGKSKVIGENAIVSYANNGDNKAFIYRLPNVFGKWCRPNYNSAIATFCYKVARDEEIWVSNEGYEMTLVYIDDVINEFIYALNRVSEKDKLYYKIPREYKKSLGEIVGKIRNFRSIRNTSIIPNMEDEFTKVLHSTYLSYLPENEFSYDLDKKVDNRGWLAELVKSNQFGQMFVSKTKPGITRGNHYHHTKVEKFIVIQGKAEIKFRDIRTSEVLSYVVDGEIPSVVDIPPGYTHSITNIGEDEVITLFWANEIFDSENPETIWCEV